MKQNPNASTAIVTRTAPLELWRDPDWQRLWLAMQERPWRSLSIVPAGEGAPPDFSLRVAVTLARTGMVHLGRPVQVADATKIPFSYLTQFMTEVRRVTGDGDSILVALAPTVNNPITVSIAQATDAVLLCVLYERMASAQAKRSVALIGQNRFIGSVVFRPDSLDAVPPGAAPGR